MKYLLLWRAFDELIDNTDSLWCSRCKEVTEILVLAFLTYWVFFTCRVTLSPYPTHNTVSNSKSLKNTSVILLL